MIRWFVHAAFAAIVIVFWLGCLVAWEALGTPAVVAPVATSPRGSDVDPRAVETGSNPVFVVPRLTPEEAARVLREDLGDRTPLLIPEPRGPVGTVVPYDPNNPGPWHYPTPRPLRRLDDSLVDGGPYDRTLTIQHR